MLVELRERGGTYTQEGETEGKGRMVDIHTEIERAQPALDRPDPRRDLFQSDATDHRGRRKDSPHRSIKSTYERAGFDQIITTHSISKAVSPNKKNDQKKKKKTL